MGITHLKVITAPDDPDYAVSTSEWNDAHVGNNLGLFNVMDYGAVADGVTDDGPAFSAAYAAADAAASIYQYEPMTVWVPPGDYRVATTIIVKDHVRVIGYGATLIGPITSFPYISAPTTAAGPTDIAAQTGGACFTDDAADTAVLDGLAFEGLHLVGFRWGFVTKCLSWSFALWKDVFFENCNAGIFAYQGAISHRIHDTLSGGASAGTTYIAAATCFPSGHALTGRDNFFCDRPTYQSEGWGRDGSVVNADFDLWFKDSILRPTTGSVVVSGTLTIGFTGDDLKPSGRVIYIPSRNRRGIYRPQITSADVYGCVRGAALIADPVHAVFRRVSGEEMFSGNPTGAMLTILLMGTEATGIFENIDGANTTNPGYAITVTPEPGGTSGPATFYDEGNILGTVNGLIGNFVSYGRDALDIFVGPYDPRGFTQTGPMTAANFAFLAPFAVKRPVARTGARTYISVQSGNIDVGIYNAAGTRLASTGSIACPATGERTVAFTGSVTLYPGVLYYLAFAANNTTVATALRTGLINTSGYVNITALPLPSTIAIPGTGTLENWMWVLT